MTSCSPGAAPGSHNAIHLSAPELIWRCIFQRCGKIIIKSASTYEKTVRLVTCKRTGAPPEPFLPIKDIPLALGMAFESISAVVLVVRY